MEFIVTLQRSRFWQAKVGFRALRGSVVGS